MERVWSENSRSVDDAEVMMPTINDSDDAERTTTESTLSERASAFSINSLLSDITRHVHTATSAGKSLLHCTHSYTSRAQRNTLLIAHFKSM